jgi:hypothetical protein
MRPRHLALALALSACSPPPRTAPAISVSSGQVAPIVAPPVALPPAPSPPRPTASVAPPDDAAARPTSFLVRTASTRYDFRIEMTAPCPADAGELGACAGPAVLHVLAKQGAELWSIALPAVSVAIDGSGAPLVNVAPLYDTQGAIIVGDFDFDGREDFAVQVDHQGPYGGPTFAVFLHDAGAERFVESVALGELTRETLGFFQVDPVKKRLITLAKSGCCFHVTEQLAVVAGKPRVVQRWTEDATGGDGMVLLTEETLVGGRWRKSQRRVPAPLP